MLNGVASSPGRFFFPIIEHGKKWPGDEAMNGGDWQAKTVEGRAKNSHLSTNEPNVTTAISESTKFALLPMTESFKSRKTPHCTWYLANTLSDTVMSLSSLV